MRRFYYFITLMICSVTAFCPAALTDVLSHSFEFRYFSRDAKANGETDFKGETAVFSTEDRIAFLGEYARYASKFFGDPECDDEVVSDGEVRDVLARLKPQPLPEVRKRIPLDAWKWNAYREGQYEESRKAVASWSEPWTAVSGGRLMISGDNVRIERTFTPQTWRFSFAVNAVLPANGAEGSFVLQNDAGVEAIVLGFDGKGSLYCVSSGKRLALGSYDSSRQVEIKCEADLTEGRYNVFVNGEKQADFVPLGSSADSITRLVINGARGESVDSLLGIGYFPSDKEASRPYSIATFMDVTFSLEPSMHHWNRKSYDDAAWETTDLPHAHGSERFAGEDLYFRKSVFVGEFERAVLNVETLDPEGEIWVNGNCAAVLRDRHPARVDIGEYLNKNAENLIAVRVRHFNIKEYGLSLMGHTPLDLNIGWFAGRISLDLTSRSYIDDALVFAKTTSDPAELEARIAIRNDASLSFRGSVKVKLTPWFPEESPRTAAETSIPVVIGSGVENIMTSIRVPNPRLWTANSPALYKTSIILCDESGAPVDDYVVSSGIRTVDQSGGQFHVNGRPDMLNGAQIFGFRAPIENLVTWNRSCPVEWLVKEILMIKKMNGNLLRVHVHAWSDPARNINDPRLPELADQLGMMMIWATPAWIRTAPGWNDIDFAGYPEYMRQVYNHPSIVMWEASNHPNAFKKRDYTESNLFCEKVYNTIYPLDPSRIISFTSFIRHLHYGNDDGTVDQDGNKIVPSPAWTADQVTRGNQDSPTGYGREWSEIRTWPPDYYKSFLASKKRGYFNFEHEESIGQPNWDLVRGKPWYRVQSYEWDYDTGSIGRRLTADEWRESQAWQAFSAYESMKKQRILDYDGFSWCCLHGGANTATYKKPLIDYEGHAKLAWYTNKMIFQPVIAGSADVDVVYGPDDTIQPVVINLGDKRTVDVVIEIRDMKDSVVDSTTYRQINLPWGRNITKLPPYKVSIPIEGYYSVVYDVR